MDSCTVEGNLLVNYFIKKVLIDELVYLKTFFSTTVVSIENKETSKIFLEGSIINIERFILRKEID